MRFSRLAFIAVSLICVSAATARAQAPSSDAGLFPFVVSYDAPENVTNVASWIDRPAGADGFVRVEDGRLATDAGPLRIWGTNLCFEACFPSHEESEALAARLARLGINGVRLHHMDNRHIWGKSGNHTEIDPQQLDRLDYLIYELKQHGIYVNINLHVSRTLDDRDGFPAKDERPKYDKGLDNFDPRNIDLQKKFARDLLTHVNPYTKATYADEPAVAMVEINNENGLLLVWSWGDLDTLPEPYASTFRSQWNAWLADKYGDTATLREAWDVGAAPLGAELLEHGGLATGEIEQPWQLQNDKTSDAEMAVVDGGPDGRKMLRVVVRRTGQQSWIPQLMYNGVSVEKGKAFTLAFEMRSDRPQSVSVLCRRTGDSYDAVGLSRKIDLTRQWQAFEFTFLATDTIDGTARIDFSGLPVGSYELAGLSLRPGGIEGLPADASLEAKNVPVLEHGNLDITRPAIDDFVDFLWETEHEYWTEMRRYIKDDLGVKSIVAGTQMSWSPTHVQAALDYCDAHAYWNHPAFPNRPWDRKDWYVRNLALVNHWSDGTLVRLAQQRVAGKPFTVSEYNHPAPNSFAAEGFPMLAAFGRFQDWDGVFLFTYSHNREFEPRAVTNFFDIKGDPTRLVHMPACAALFLRGDVEPARETVLLGLDEPAERAMLRERLSPRFSNLEAAGVGPLVALEHAVAVDLSGKTTSPRPEANDEAETIASDTRQLFYDQSNPDGGAFAVLTPKTVLVTGFGERRYPLGKVSLEIEKTQLNWATVSMTAIDGQTLTAPGRKLLAATGWMQNTGQVTEDLGGHRITLRDKWGAPPVLCEGIAASVKLAVDPAQVAWYALDESGARREKLTVDSDDDGYAVLKLAPKHKTLWYEIEIW